MQFASKPVGTRALLRPAAFGSTQRTAVVNSPVGSTAAVPDNGDGNVVKPMKPGE